MDTLPTLDVLGEAFPSVREAKEIAPHRPRPWGLLCGAALAPLSCYTLATETKGGRLSRKGRKKWCCSQFLASPEPQRAGTQQQPQLIPHPNPIPFPIPCADTSRAEGPWLLSLLVKSAAPDTQDKGTRLDWRGALMCQCPGPLSSLTSAHTALLPVGLRGLVASRAPEGSIWRPFIPLN